MVEPDLSDYRITHHLVQTLCDQAHLCPLPLTVQPVYWPYDHALRLYPLPDLLILGDRYQEYDHTYADCKVCNPGSFPTDFSFMTYVAGRKRVDFRKLEPENGEEEEEEAGVPGDEDDRVLSREDLIDIGENGEEVVGAAGDESESSEFEQEQIGADEDNAGSDAEGEEEEGGEQEGRADVVEEVEEVEEDKMDWDPIGSFSEAKEEADAEAPPPLPNTLRSPFTTQHSPAV